jgi:polar amino acid transport system permease protein
MIWGWLPEYGAALVRGVGYTILLLVVSCSLGMVLAVPIGYAQARRVRVAGQLSAAFCYCIRGTPLLIQIWLIYFGLGATMASIPGITQSYVWPVLREPLVFALIAYTLSFAGYVGEILRAAFLSVPIGEVEAAKAFAMTRSTMLRRVLIPRAIALSKPTLINEVVLQLKATPLAFTITVPELMGVTSSIRQETYRVYEPLLLAAIIYVILALIIQGLARSLGNKRNPGV